MLQNGEVTRRHKPLTSLAALFVCWAGAHGAEKTARAPPAPPKLYRAAVEAHWLADGHGFWHRNENPRGVTEFTIVYAEHRTRKVVSQADIEEHMSAGVSALNRGIPFALRPRCKSSQSLCITYKSGGERGTCGIHARAIQ
jgi:hypothetical protein